MVATGEQGHAGTPHQDPVTFSLWQLQCPEPQHITRGLPSNFYTFIAMI
jgi:hypothetical protein